MKGYQTEQRATLLRFLEDNRERAFTIEEAVAELQRTCGEAAPGKSTVYRLMQRLVEEKEVKRLVAGNSRRFVYQLTDDETCHRHLHMKCNKCGRLFHLEERVSHELARRVAAAGGFALCEADTVLLGECAECHKGREAHA